jgi:hypothetical protein
MPWGKHVGVHHRLESSVSGRDCADETAHGQRGLLGSKDSLKMQAHRKYSRTEGMHTQGSVHTWEV